MSKEHCTNRLLTVHSREPDEEKGRGLSRRDPPQSTVLRTTQSIAAASPRSASPPTRTARAADKAGPSHGSARSHPRGDSERTAARAVQRARGREGDLQLRVAADTRAQSSGALVHGEPGRQPGPRRARGVWALPPPLRWSQRLPPAPDEVPQTHDANRQEGGPDPAGRIRALTRLSPRDGHERPVPRASRLRRRRATAGAGVICIGLASPGLDEYVGPGKSVRPSSPARGRGTS